MKVLKFSACLSAVVMALFCRAQVPSGTSAIQSPAGPSLAVVVERVDKNTEADKVGLLPGDVLSTWSQGGEAGPIQTPFDITWIEAKAQRGPVRLEGLRNNAPKSWTLGPDRWILKARPDPTGTLSAAAREAVSLAASGKPAEAAERWRAIAASPESDQPSWLKAWALMRAGELFFEARQWQPFESAFGEALAAAGSEAHVVRIKICFSWGFLSLQRGDLERALHLYEQAIAESRRISSPNFVTVNGLLALSTVAWMRGDLQTSGQAAQEALEISNQQAPGSMATSWAANAVGLLAVERGDLANADIYFTQSLAILEKRSTTGVDNFRLLSNLGFVAWQRNDLQRAQDYFMQALARMEKLGLGSSLEQAKILDNLGLVALRAGDTQNAEAVLLRAQALKQKLAPDGNDLAETLNDLGVVEEVRGNLDESEKNLRAALDIRQRKLPGTLAVSRTLNHIGEVLADRRDFAGAEAMHRQALAIIVKLAPGSSAYSETLASLAGSVQRQNRLDEAAGFYQQALLALESETDRLGGSNDARSGFRAAHSQYYRDYIQLLIAQRKPEEAFAVLERSRARTLLETLAVGQIDVHQGADPALLEQERRLQTDIKSKRDRRTQVLATGRASDDEIQAIQKDLSDLMGRYQENEARIRVTSPRYAALTQPQPMGAKELQQHLLDTDTILLEYSLGEERGYLFVLGRDSLHVFELPGRQTVEQSAHRVYELLTERNRAKPGETATQRQSRWAAKESSLPRAAADLSRMILGPAAADIQGKRLLIVADGALQFIPFAMLPEPATGPLRNHSSSSMAPLMARHEVLNLPSASALAEIRRERKERASPTKGVAVLADPVFDKLDSRVPSGGAAKHSGSQHGATVTDAFAKPTASSADFSVAATTPADQLVRSAADIGFDRDGGLHLPRLRYTRQEAEAIRAATPPGQAWAALDFDATRATAMSPKLGQYRIIHLATHGLLNSEHPELSGLVFSLVDKDGNPQDGFLQLQDIYNLNLPADLVVLSACETGLGKEISGEGLVGLTRGFMYAGASRVVASLWNVSDVAAAKFMTAFYTSMEKDGLPPAAALRAAQIHMWKQKRWSSPYYWAAFQIQGEWK